MSRLTDLSVVCLLDESILHELARSRPTTKAARHDQSVVDSLKKLYRRVSSIAFTEGDHRWIDRLLHERPDVVFNLAQSACPLEPSVAACLEIFGCAYTGSGPFGIMLTNDKVRSRRLLQAARLRVPQFVELSPGQPIRFSLKPPLIVRPASSAGSSGIYADSVTMRPDDVPRLAERIWKRFSVSALCEEFIVGREFRIGMLQDNRGRFRSVGVFESTMAADRPGWAFRTHAIRNNPRVARANSATQRYVGRPSHLVAALTDASRQALGLLDVEGYGTLDFRVDASGNPVILEVNSNPGLVAGPFWGRRSFASTLRSIVESAIRRNQRRDR